MYRIKTLSFSLKTTTGDNQKLDTVCTTCESDDSYLTEFVTDDELPSIEPPDGKHFILALKVGEPIMRLRLKDDKQGWSSGHRYTDEGWWVTDVGEFEGRLYAWTSVKKVAEMDVLGAAAAACPSVWLLETGSYDEDEETSCHFLDVETDEDIYILKIEARGRDFVEFTKW